MIRNFAFRCTFLVVPQSQFTSREPQGVYSGFQRCPTRDEILLPVEQSNRKKGQHFQKKILNFQKISK